MPFIVKFTEPGKAGLQTLHNDRGKQQGKERLFTTRQDAEAVAAVRGLQKALVVPASRDHGAEGD